MFSNPSKQFIDIEIQRPIIESKHQDLLKKNTAANQGMPF